MITAMKLIFIIISLYSTLMMASIPTRSDALLFCLNPDVNPLKIIENSRSLNLSNTVSIIIYEAWKQINFYSN